MKPENHDPSALELLWLDFDGVLHPCPLPETKRDSGRYEAELFQSADVLAEMLRPCRAPRVVYQLGPELWARSHAKALAQ
jgi:5'-3' exonuclease